ncbi:hypothetical protein FGB62_169g237 [Gracilaria domingensis]|nr:hypothetical protein FGB62_169g237 [Gracilaria domingensis]
MQEYYNSKSRVQAERDAQRELVHFGPDDNLEEAGQSLYHQLQGCCYEDTTSKESTGLETVLIAIDGISIRRDAFASQILCSATTNLALRPARQGRDSNGITDQLWLSVMKNTVRSSDQEARLSRLKSEVFRQSAATNPNLRDVPDTLDSFLPNAKCKHDLETTVCLIENEIDCLKCMESRKAIVNQNQEKIS